jgi:hypothetical protein
MNLPFTSEQFLEVFKNYNLAIWPMQIIAYVSGIAVLVLTKKKTAYSGRVIWCILSFYWLWMGGVYHITYFASINLVAYGFGLLFIVQGILFLWIGTAKPEIRFRFILEIRFITGAVFILYALLIYPLIGYFAGHRFPQSPLFGVAPCPTTIFTFGLFLWAEQKVPKYILIIPALWSVIGFLAAIYLGIVEDIGLLFAGVIGIPLTIFPGRKENQTAGGLDCYVD